MWREPSACRWVGLPAPRPGAMSFTRTVPASVPSVRQSSLLRLLAMLPRQRVNAVLAEEFNRVARAELESVRDYQLLRYVLSGRRDTPFRIDGKGLYPSEFSEGRVLEVAHSYADFSFALYRDFPDPGRKAG